jgi:hypothetical protein
VESVELLLEKHADAVKRWAPQLPPLHPCALLLERWKEEPNKTVGLAGVDQGDVGGIMVPTLTLPKTPPRSRSTPRSLTPRAALTASAMEGEWHDVKVSVLSLNIVLLIDR